MLRRLSVHGFRCLPTLRWSLSGGSHLIEGPNGAGKTSLLEAAYLVATTRSFRTPRLRECLCSVARSPFTEPPRSFGISAEIDGDRRARLDVMWNEGSLTRELDSKAVPLAAYLEPLPVVVWSTQEAEIMEGSPERRRRMLDRGLITEDLSRLAVVSRYAHCLRQKRELLRRQQGGIAEWNHLLADAASQLVEARSRYVALLEKFLQEALVEAGLKMPMVRLDYRPSPASARSGKLAIEEALAESAAEETRLRRPLIGPHRDRLAILWRDKEVSEMASAGEKKALGLLLVAAQVRLLEKAGRPPLVVADDVDTELDVASFSRVWKVLQSARQVLASSNRPEVWEAVDVSTRWTLRDGSLSMKIGNK